MQTPIAPLPADSWVERLPAVVRLLLLGLAFLLTIFAMGVVIGVASRAIELGEVRQRGLLALAVAVPAGAAFAWLTWRLTSHWRRPGLSGYEQRHTRMLLTIVALGLPLGLLLGLASGPDISAVATGPIAPWMAILTAAVLAISMSVSLFLYHRTIDDHEQQAYFRANSLAFYFLVIAIPAAWLLSRGGLIPPLGAGPVMLILFASMLINFAAWAVLKFR